MRQVILYGISGASRAYTVLNYFCIYEEFVSIGTIVGEARRLRMKNPDVEHVYAIDNRYGISTIIMNEMRKILRKADFDGDLIAVIPIEH